MTPTVFVLVLLSASLHVVWNALVKKADNKASFAFLTTLTATVLLLPLFVCLRVLSDRPLGGQVWLWAALSGGFEAAYIVLLFGAYDKADLSVVYPLSRGIAPLVTLAVGGLLVGDAVNLWSGLAVLLVVAGVTAVSFSSGPASASARRSAGVALALAAGVMIAGYHLVDRRARGPARGPAPPASHIHLHLFLTTFVALWVFARRRLRAGAWREWSRNRRDVLIVGCLGPLSYFLILLAMSQAAGNVTYISAGRNVGIVMSTAAGGLLLRERICWRRAVGAALITLGVAALVLLGRAG